MIPFGANGSPGTRGLAGDAQRRATALAVAVLCLIMGSRAFSDLYYGAPGQLPFTVALFVVPLLYAFARPRRVLARHRVTVLAVQGAATWVPFAVFGHSWQVGIDGLLAGLVLLTVSGRAAWLLAGGLLAAEVAIRSGVTGLPVRPAWFAVFYVVAYYVDDGLAFFGMIRLAQIVDEVEDARSRAAALAVADERLLAARSLHSAVGQRLAYISAMAAAARRGLSRDAAQARARIAEAGITAREAVARAREVAAGDRSLPRREPAATPFTGAVIGAQLAWLVVLVTLAMFVAENIGYSVQAHYSALLLVLAVGDIVLAAALQVYHSDAVRRGRRPRAWPVTLGLQAVLVYAFLFPFVWAYVGFLGPFLAGSFLLLFSGRWRWYVFVALVTSYAVLYTVLPVRGNPIAAGHQVPLTFMYAAVAAGIGLLVYGLSRLAGLARELEGLHGELAQVAAVRERLRVARDVHDLLGLGLSAVALKTDLIGALIGRDDSRAAAEMEEMGRICAAARADIRLVTGDGQRLSLADELTAARQILASAGVEVRAGIPAGPLPATADDVLAPVLREAITNVLRHAAATACAIEVTADGSAVRLRVSNDGATEPGAAARPAAGGGGRGLANLSARVQAAGGQLTSRRLGGRFELTAQIPLPGQPGVDDPLAAGHGADRADETLGGPVLEQVSGYPGGQRRG
jgi:two-component system sensor histidine kinase DesK